MMIINRTFFILIAAMSLMLTACQNTGQIAGAPASVSFVGPTTVSTGACVAGYTLTLLDSNGNSAPATSATVFALTGMGTGAYYSDSACTAAITSVTIPEKGTSVSFYFKDTIAEVPTWTASNASFPSVSLTATVVGSMVSTQFGITGPTAVPAGTCAAVYVVSLKDAFGNLVIPTSNIAVTFSGLGSAHFYSDAICTATIASTTIPAGSSAAWFYLKDSVTEALSISFSVAGAGSSTYSVSVNSGTVSGAVLNTPLLVNVGQCLATSVTLVDSLGNNATSTAATAVTLGGVNNGNFYSDSGCTTAITSATIPVGASSQTIYFQDNVTEGLLLTTAIGAAAKTIRFSSVVSAATKLVVSGPLSLATGVCSAAYLVSSQDIFGNVANLSSTTAVSLSAGSYGKLYSDSGCTSVVTSVSIAANSNSAKFYFKDSYPEDLVITAVTGTISGSAAVVVTSTTPSRVILAGSSTPTEAVCVPYTVTSADLYGNPSRVSAATAVALLGKGTGNFYSTNTCASTITTVSIAAGAYSATFYFKDTIAESLAFTGTATGLTGGSLQVAVIGGASTKIVVSGATTAATSACTPYTIQTQDANSVASAGVASPLTVNLTGGLAGAFYSDPGCSSSITSTVISTGNSTVVYFSDGTAQSPVLSAADAAASLTTGTLTVAISGTKLVLSGTAAISTATCTAYTVQNMTSASVLTNVGSLTTVALTGNGTGTFYSNVGCTTTATTVAIANGTSSATFYYKNASAQQITMQGAVAGFATGTLPVTIGTLAPTKLVLTGSSSVSSAACSSAYTITSQNVNSVAANVAANTTVTLIGSGSGAFYSDIACSTAVTTVQIGIGTSSQTFYLKDGLQESLYLSTTAAALTTGMLGVSVVGTTPTQVSVSGQGEVPSGVCSARYTVTSRDVNGNSSNVTGSQTINLASSGTGTFYSDSGCTTSVSSLTMNSGTSTTGFYFKSSTLGPQTFTASHSSMSSGFFGVTIMSNVSQIAAGQKHTCALVNGGVKCWGLGTNGQLGNGLLLNTAIPVDVRGLGAGSGVTAIAVGQLHSCALKAGAVYCWGLNSSGQLGDTTATQRPIPVAVQGLPTSGITAIAAGGAHTCALASGAIYCWGAGASGQLGLGSSANVTTATLVPGFGSGLISIGAGGNHTCAVSGSGSVQCTGFNTSGQLGDNTLLTRFSPVSVQSLSGSVTAISTGNTHTCALMADGTVQCWGANGSGQIGDGTQTTRTLPVTVLGLPSSASAVVAGNTYSCAIVSGAPYCFGFNTDGELGVNTIVASLVPLATLNISSGVTSIALGMVGNHTCVVVGGQVRCWGMNDSGQLGNGYLAQSWTPLAVQGLLTTASAIAAGTSHTCAVLTSGVVQCWGLNSTGQLGDNTVTTRSTAVQVSGLSATATGVAGGASHTCALLSTGAIQCWGTNSSGQYGNGTNTQSNVATASGFSGFASSLATGANHTCAVIGGGVYCTGINSNGQLGNGTVNTQFSPVQVTGIITGSGATAVAAGASHTCAIVNGAVYCWGLNGNGQLGNNTVTQSTTPVLVQGLTGTITQITAGTAHTCAVNSTGAAFCWGLNSNGQLGNSTVAQSLVAVPVDTLTSGVTLLATGPASAHTCDVNSAAIQCWGLNSSRQLGLASTAQAIQPTAQPDLTSGATAVTTGAQHSCAIVSGAVYCWGDDLNGKLGDNAPAISSFIPVPVQTLPL